MNNLEDVISILDSINDKEDLQYDYCKSYFKMSLPAYEKILEEIIKRNIKRVIDVGSNLNQYGYLFANADIEYIGIDIDTKRQGWNPIEADMIKFISGDYLSMIERFKNETIISNMCIGYLIPLNVVKCKLFIRANFVMGFTKNKPIYKLEIIENLNL